MSSTSRWVHPETTSLIRKRDEIHRLLYSDYSPVSAIEQMIGLSNNLRRADRDTELHETLLKNHSYLTRMRSQTERNIQGKNMKRVLWGHLEKLNDILTEKGYLTSEKYSGIDLKAFDAKKHGEIQ